jgi:hypothetical protein
MSVSPLSLDGINAALDDAFADVVKARFSIACNNVSGGESAASAIEKFGRGLPQIKSLREKAGAVAATVFAKGEMTQ